MPYAVIILRPDGTRTETIQAKAPEYDQLKEAVQGYIETVPHLSKLDPYKRGRAYVNEEGILKNMPFNEQATRVWLENLGKGPFRYPPRLHGPMIYYAKMKG